MTKARKTPMKKRLTKKQVVEYNTKIKSATYFPTDIKSTFSSPYYFSNMEKDTDDFASPLIWDESCEDSTCIKETIKGKFPLKNEYDIYNPLLMQLNKVEDPELYTKLQEYIQKNNSLSITLGQDKKRNLSYIPSCVQISTEWKGDPQPGLLTYQWAVASKFNIDECQPFSNTYNGKSYEPSPTQTVALPFPRFKGMESFQVGKLSTLQLIVTMSPCATSELISMSVTIFHKRLEKKE